MLEPHEIEALEAALREKLPSLDQKGVRNVRRAHGVGAREIHHFELVYEDTAGEQTRGLLLRREMEAGAHEGRLALEHAAYQSFQDVDVPTPTPIAFAAEGGALGRPYLIAERSAQGQLASLFSADPYGAHREAIGRRFFSILGAIAAVDPYDTQIPGIVDTPAPEDCWRRELDHWESVIDDNALEPQPIAAAAIRRLRRNPPAPPPKLSVVHGNFRNGNFLHDGQGGITGVVDWELAHIGDPMEDVAWALDPVWAGASKLAAGLIDIDEAIKPWQEASGRRFNGEAFRWWSLFANVKGLAIWLSSAKAFHENKNTDPVLAFAGWHFTTRHNSIIAHRLSEAAPGSLI
ncbi:MAG: phosphotransferase family protein [Hyphomonadaceae bacterium]